MLDDPPHFKIWPYLISFSFVFLKIFPRCYIPIFDGLVIYLQQHCDVSPSPISNDNNVILVNIIKIVNFSQQISFFLYLPNFR